MVNYNHDNKMGMSEGVSALSYRIDVSGAIASLLKGNACGLRSASGARGLEPFVDTGGIHRVCEKISLIFVAILAP